MILIKKFFSLGVNLGVFLMNITSKSLCKFSEFLFEIYCTLEFYREGWKLGVGSTEPQSTWVASIGRPAPGAY